MTSTAVPACGRGGDDGAPRQDAESAVAQAQRCDPRRAGGRGGRIGGPAPGCGARDDGRTGVLGLRARRTPILGHVAVGVVVGVGLDVGVVEDDAGKAPEIVAGLPSGKTPSDV